MMFLKNSYFFLCPTLWGKARRQWVGLCTLLAIFLITLFIPKPSLADDITSVEAARVDKIRKELAEKVGDLEKFDDHGITRAKVPVSFFVDYYLSLQSGVQQATYGAQSMQQLQSASRGQFAPSLNLAYSQVQTPLFWYSDTSAAGATGPNKTVSFGQMTPLGISYNVSYSNQSMQRYLLQPNTPLDLNKYTKTSIPDEYTNTLGLTVNVPIFQNFGDPVTAQSKKAEIAAQKAELQRQGVIDSIALQVIGLYWDMKALFTQLEAFRKQAEVSDSLLAQIEQRVKIGLLPQTALLDQKAQSLQAHSSLMAAESQVLSVEDTIKQTVGLSDLPYGIYPISDFAEQELDATTAIVQQVLAYSKDKKAAELDQESVRADQVAADNKLRPNVDLNLNYNIYGYGYSQSGADLVNNKNVNSYTATLNWNIPLGNDGSRNASNANKLLLAQKTLQTTDLVNTLSVNVRTSLRTLEVNKNQVAAGKLQVEMRKQLLEAEITRLKLGQSNTTNVADAQSKLLMAQQGLNTAESSYQKSFFGIEISRGRLYSYFPELKNFIIPEETK